MRLRHQGRSALASALLDRHHDLNGHGADEDRVDRPPGPLSIADQVLDPARRNREAALLHILFTQYTSVKMPEQSEGI